MKTESTLTGPNLIQRIYQLALFRILRSCIPLQAGLIVLFAVLNISDGMLTYYGLIYCDLVEANPILDFVSRAFGTGCSIVVIKALIVVPLAYAFISRSSIQRCRGTLVLIMGNLLYFWVVGNNANLILFADL